MADRPASSKSALIASSKGRWASQADLRKPRYGRARVAFATSMKARCRYTQSKCAGRCISADLAAAEAYKLAKQIRSTIGKRLDILAANAGIPKLAKRAALMK